MGRILTIILASLGILFITFAFFFAYLWYDFITKRYIEEEKIFIVEKGETLKNVAKRLKEEGLLSNTLSVILFSKKYEKDIKYGEYELSGAISPKDIIRTLSVGKFRTHKITVVEGDTIYHIATKLESKGICSRFDFLNSAKDKEFLLKMGVESETAEGFIFPSTYLFPKNQDPYKLLEIMISNFFKNLGNERLIEIEKKDLTLKFVVTLASIVEKEAQISGEKKRIAGVFFNRLKKRMKLQADPTVMYGLELFDIPPTPEILKIDNPYNTYTRGGLPPTPICNPSLESIDAVLHPEINDFLYFVSRGDGTHEFSKTFDEHTKNIAKIKELREAGVKGEEE